MHESYIIDIDRTNVISFKAYAYLEFHCLKSQNYTTGIFPCLFFLKKKKIKNYCENITVMNNQI